MGVGPLSHENSVDTNEGMRYHLGGASLQPTTKCAPGCQRECRWPNLPDMRLSTLPYSCLTPQTHTHYSELLPPDSQSTVGFRLMLPYISYLVVFSTGSARPQPPTVTAQC
eukprot:932574-Rhodomonas_salina.1